MKSIVTKLVIYKKDPRFDYCPTPYYCEGHFVGGGQFCSYCGITDTQAQEKEIDGLAQSWRGEVVFCNPPYGRDISKWVAKAYAETLSGGAKLVVLLIPARTDTAYFHDYIYKKHEIRFVRGRLHFNESKCGAPFPSMVVVMRGRNDD